MLFFRLFGAMCALFFLAITQVQAQSITVSATATVLNPISLPEINITYVEPGAMGQNQPAGVTGQARPGRLQASGETSNKISTTTIALPLEYSHLGNSVQVPVTFSDDSRKTPITKALPNSPATGLLTYTVQYNDDNKLYLWLEGSGQPTAGKAPGVSSTNVILNVAHTAH